MEKKSLRRRANARVTKARWSAYVTAGAASAFACATSAEAAIHYTAVNQVFNVAAGASSVKVFGLASPAQFSVRDYLHTDGVRGHASFGIFQGAAGVSAAFAGYALGSLSRYASKLALGANISNRNFITNGGYFAYLARHATYGQFKTAGIGFVGIKFNIGAGTQYGWVEFNMAGGPKNNFTLLAYAYGDVGTTITAGQGIPTAVPEPGSLALLAVGGAGLLAWRKRRAQAATVETTPVA